MNEGQAAATHLRFEMTHEAVCGARPPVGDLRFDPKSVTCDRCRRNEIWRAAMDELARAAMPPSVKGHEGCDAEILSLEAERDAYRAQATAFAEKLVELGHQDFVDAAIAAAGERE